jgi:serine/threonine protein kinase
MVASKTQLAELRALVGHVLDGRYELDGIVAFGGMGTVFRGRHEAIGKPCAIKVLLPQISADDDAQARFAREAYAASLLDHPNCVRIYDYGTTTDGLAYLVMELLSGTELTSFMVEPMAPGLAVDRIRQVLCGLAHAHEHGLIHRDLKPGNIFVAQRDGHETLKLLDFGIAKLIDDPQVKQRLTKTGIVFGTPHYMSPEQARGKLVDARSDLYSVGLLLYEMLAGRRPFRGGDAYELIQRRLLQPLDPLPTTIPPPLARIVASLLEASPDDRPPNAVAVIEALDENRSALEGIPAAPIGASRDTAATVRDHPSSGPAPMAEPPTRSGSRFRASVIVTGGLLVTACLAWLLRSPREDAAERDHEPLQAMPASAPASEATSGRPTRASEAPTRIELTFVTPGVRAEVIDARDGGRLGTSNPHEDPTDALERIRFDRSDAPIPVILRADGHLDASLDVVPAHDKTYVQPLEPQRVRRPSKKPLPEPQPASKHTPNLADPFNRPPPREPVD